MPVPPGGGVSVADKAGVIGHSWAVAWDVNQLRLVVAITVRAFVVHACLFFFVALGARLGNALL